MVSVCIATYNGEKYIKEQIESILCQLTPDDEIIISDDGSKDNTVRIVDSFHDHRIKVFINNGKHGVIFNFENALKQAAGDYIFLCDQDDVWENDKVQTCTAYLKNKDLILHDASLIDKHGKKYCNSYFSLRNSKIGYFNNLYRNSYLGCCMAFRKELLKYIFPFPKHIEMHDRWIGLQAEIYGETALVHKSLSKYRIHGNNVSNSTEKSHNSIYKMLSIRFWMLYYTLYYRIFHLK